MYHENLVTDDYMRLINEFRLESICDEAHLQRALAMIDRLAFKAERSVGESAYLSALTDLVETYEDAHVSVPEVSGVDLLRYLMEENGLTQRDLVPLLGTPSIVSEVLAGKRRLALSHIQRLSSHFGLPADVFMATGPEDTAPAIARHAGAGS